MKAPQQLNNDYMTYALYCIYHRAIPRLEDGLKPSQRAILETMNNMKAFNFTKSANVEGQVMKLLPHGSCYPTIVKMAQIDYQNNPLIVGKGNFARHCFKEMTAAASRYTECKLSQEAKFLMEDINKEYCTKKPNYDGTLTQCDVLPVKFPYLLNQYSRGMAVGYGTNILPLNAKELAKAISDYVIEGKKTMLYPDLPFDGHITKDESTLAKFNETGTGTFTIRGNATINGNSIDITSIPHSTSVEEILKAIWKLVDEGKLKGVIDALNSSEYKPKTDDYKVGIEIQCRKNSDKEEILREIYAKTPLQCTISSNLVAIFENEIQELGIWQAIDKWIAWRVDNIKRDIEFSIQKLEKEIELLLGLTKITDIEQALEIVRFSDDSIGDLKKNFSLTNTQAEYINNLQARHFTNKWFSKEASKISEAISKLDILQANKDDKMYIYTQMLKGVNEYANKFGKERRLKLSDCKINAPTQTKVKAIDMDEEFRVIVTKEGFISKSSDSAKITLKPGDEIVYDKSMKNNECIIAFNENGEMAQRIRVDKLPIVKGQGVGTFYNQFIDIEGFKLQALIPMKSGEIVTLIAKCGRLVNIPAKSYHATTKMVKQYKPELDVIDIRVSPNPITYNLKLEKDRILNVNSHNYSVQKSITSQGHKISKYEILEVKGVS